MVSLFTRLVSLTCMVILSTAAVSAGPQSDIQRLSGALAPEFKRTKVLLYPPVSFTALENPSVVPAVEKSSLWLQLVKELERYPNLKVYSPDSVRRGIRKRHRYDVNRAEALERAKWGREAYREVRLKSAVEKLRSALNLLLEIEYYQESSDGLARVALTLGHALLEAGNLLQATEAFKRALLLDPALRLKKGFDRADAVRVFETARRNLIQDGAAPLHRDQLAEISSKRANIRTSIRTYFSEKETIVVIRTPQGRQVERLERTDAPKQDASRLGSRIFANLPFGYTPEDRRSRKLFLDAGFAGFTYASSPVGLVPHFAVQTNTTLVVEEKLSLEASLQLASSGRDHHEHLRKDLNTVRVLVGAGAQSEWSRWSLFGHVGLQVDYQSPVLITTTVACKYFSKDDDVPPTLCDFDGDFDRSDASWSIGVGVSAGIRFEVMKPIYLIARTTTATYAFQSANNDFSLPFGASLALAYQLF